MSRTEAMGVTFAPFVYHASRDDGVGLEFPSSVARRKSFRSYCPQTAHRGGARGAVL